MKKYKKILISLFAPLSISSIITSAKCQPNSTSQDQQFDQWTNKLNSEVYTNLVAPSIKSAKKLIYKPSDFYASLDGKSGAELRNELFRIQKEHRNNTKTYAHLYNTYYDAFIDRYYENDGTLLDLYGENPNGKDPFTFDKKNHEGRAAHNNSPYVLRHKGKNNNSKSREGQIYNREHIIPQSWFGKQEPMRNDAHFVWPSDKLVNEKHANYPYGTVKNISYKSKNGTKIGSSLEDNGPVTEVINEFKGDLARAIFYFTLTYQDQDIRMTDQARRFFDDDNQIKTTYLKTLLTWSDKDPLTQFDLDRNNYTFKHQKNRNPFLDYPELIKVVFEYDNNYVFKNKGLLTRFEF
ncbi:endonuclease [Mycoplasmopsis opalescens]|uniref:endonuclease n=1 Tax=Mycoplasmopsis opalescens TaxID=114886 RepID=UPI00068D16F8|nr:endonuclease [Mycoplasmopsis opalescens]